MRSSRVTLFVKSHPDKIVDYLSNTENILPILPYTTGRSRGKVKLEFRRLRVFRFVDEFEVRSIRQDRSLTLLFEGSRSRIRFFFRPEESSVTVLIDYDGPRGWIVGKYLSEIASVLVYEADKAVHSTKSIEAVADLSANLARISWISRLLMKSVMIKNETRVVSKGGLLDYIESLIMEEKVFSKYPGLYISGDGVNSKMRLLFLNGELKGVYVVLGDKEFFGDENVLKEIGGLMRIRVYGIIRPELVLRS